MKNLRRLGLAVFWITFTLICVWLALRIDGERDNAGGAIEELYRAQRSGVFVEANGVVERLFSDDLRGSKHQRFLVRLHSGKTVLISHNIDLAPRIDSLRVGDPIGFRGEYEWNDKGGVVHWTHHDPDGRRPGGWLRHEGRTYR